MTTDKRMAIKPALNQFNGGEIQPQLEGRFDWDKYNYSAKLCKNFIPTVEGYLKRRGGSHNIALKRGSGLYSFKIHVTLKDYAQITPSPVPTLTINNETVTLNSESQFYLTGNYVTDTLTYLDGTRLVYSLSATQGYITKQGVIVVDINQSDISLEITTSSADTVTVKFVTPSAATVTLNGVTSNTITDAIGTTVNYSVSLLGASTNGSITLSENKNYYVYKAESVIVVTDSDILQVDYNSDGTILLPACKVRYIGVGAGGGAKKFSGMNFYKCGGSGAGCDVILNLAEGSYEWNVGSVGITGSSHTNGGDTYIKNSSTHIIYNGGGIKAAPGFFGAEGGVNTINNSFLYSTNWVKSGNKAYDVRGASVYKGYGTGAGYINDNHTGFQNGTDGYLYLSFVGE